MKKLFCSLLLTFSLFSLSFADKGLVTFNAGLSTGIPFYESASLPEQAGSIDTDYRVIIGTFANINLNVIEQISFFAGGDLLSDFNWKSELYNHHLHVSFPLGFKVFPGLGGLDIGLAYTLGFRSDFLKNSSKDKSNNIASWGNGFKLIIEYDFSHNKKSNYLPVIGCSWNLMPRGNNSYDNLLVFYLAENF